MCLEVDELHGGDASAVVWLWVFYPIQMKENLLKCSFIKISSIEMKKKALPEDTRR